MHTSTAKPGYSTSEAARRFHVKEQTLRAALCRDGHYLGIRPRKLPNRMLDWPAEQVDAALQQAA
jgi:hypothetical protein